MLSDYVCLAIVRQLKPHFLGRDFSGCMRVLQHFAPFDVDILLFDAYNMRNSDGPPKSVHSRSSSRRSPPTNQSPSLSDWDRPVSHEGHHRLALVKNMKGIFQTHQSEVRFECTQSNPPDPPPHASERARTNRALNGGASMSGDGAERSPTPPVDLLM
eukprot:GHVO01034191.1.p1 GENE.GHVO01034191.1~~GHVO01034191.1.p1  ORF type:complete len:158 (-),score=28.04 GHVO01034191.1:195-668(-)